MQHLSKVVRKSFIIKVDYNYDVGGKDEVASDILLNIERPRSWTELMKLLYTHDEYHHMKNEHGDGYFYLLYLKLTARLFAFSKCLHIQ